MKFSVLAIFIGSLFSANAGASQLYFVEPMVCKGKLNKIPSGWSSDYEYAALKIVSFKSVRASDCSEAPSSGTEVIFGKEKSERSSIHDRIDGVGNSSWFGAPLKKNGKEISIPFGIWPNPMTLTIVKSSTQNGKQVDVLKGRYNADSGSYYDLICEAIVVENPSHVENGTSNCRR